MNLKSAQTGKIGKIFKNSRMRKSLSQEEIAREIFINIEYIKAIELGDYSVFPARTYAIKYFEKYAHYLGLDITFFDIYNADVVAEAERNELPKSVYEPFLEKNKIFTSILIFLTLIAIIFLLLSNEISDQQFKDDFQDTKIIDSLKINLEQKLLQKPELDELHDEINSFLNQDMLDSNKVSVNVDLIEHANE